MREYLEIGCSPVGEPCIQTTNPDSSRLGRLECEVYRKQLIRQFGEGPFRIKSFPHDFGSYCEGSCLL